MAGAAAGCARMTLAATSTSSTQPWGASRPSASSTTLAAERSVERKKYILREKSWFLGLRGPARVCDE